MNTDSPLEALHPLGQASGSIIEGSNTYTPQPAFRSCRKLKYAVDLIPFRDIDIFSFLHWSTRQRDTFHRGDHNKASPHHPSPATTAQVLVVQQSGCTAGIKVEATAKQHGPGRETSTQPVTFREESDVQRVTFRGNSEVVYTYFK